MHCNKSLVARIAETTAQFEVGNVSYVHLRDVLESTAKGIESLPYSMVIELRSIESSLAIEQGYEEENCEAKPHEALIQLRLWLEKVPQ